MRYDMPLYRPPSEAYSLIIQATLGCSHNKCTFCSMYRSKKFTIKTVEQIKKEIDYFRNNVDISSINRVFIADGDALIMKFPDLKEILKYIKESFPKCSRVSMYASPKSIELKTEEELVELKNLGLFLVYLGLESGDDDVLKDINKGVTPREILESAKKVKRAGIKLSVTAIAGLAGKENTKSHSINTAKIISEMAPEYFSILTLRYEPVTEMYAKIKSGALTPLKNYEILQEVREIISNIDTKTPIIFRGNHASNYVSLGGTLPKDKAKILEDIDINLEKGNYIPEDMRQL